MSSINSARKFQILYFSKKNKKIKNLKNGERKSGPISAFIHTTPPHWFLTEGSPYQNLRANPSLGKQSTYC